MQTLIIGGGLLGLATAQVLVERGENVRVLEAREGVGLETSFANAGHGALGWTMAMGSAHLLADQISGRPVEIDCKPFLVTRTN